MQRIALIGLGTMGSAMAANWLGKGFPIAVFNRSRAKADVLAANGARVASSPRDAADGADVVVAMVADDEASRQVWCGDDGALAGTRRGAIAIEASTLSPGWILKLGAKAAEASVGFLDAPVGGGGAAALAGTLSVFVGGAAATLEAARPVLSAIGSRIEHVGDVGAGVTWKLVNYMMVGAQLAGLAEALALAEKAGIDRRRAGDLIGNSVAASPAVVGKLPRMVERRFGEPDVALRLVAKDQRYAAEFARSLGANLEISPAVAEMFRRAESEGLGDLDLAAIAETVRRRAGFTP